MRQIERSAVTAKSCRHGQYHVWRTSFASKQSVGMLSSPAAWYAERRRARSWSYGFRMKESEWRE